MTWAIAASSGIATAPGYAFAGDTDTGFWRPAANTLGWSTASTERMRLDATGLSIGSTSTATALAVSGDIAIANQNTLRFYELSSNGGNYLAFKAPAAVTSNVAWTLPSAD